MFAFSVHSRWAMSLRIAVWALVAVSTVTGKHKSLQLSSLIRTDHSCPCNCHNQFAWRAVRSPVAREPFPVIQVGARLPRGNVRVDAVSLPLLLMAYPIL